MPRGREVGLGFGDIVLDGTELPLPKRGTAPNFRPMSNCGKTAGCISIPLGTEVGLGPDDVVLDGVPAPPYQGHSLPNFQRMSIVAKRLDGLIKMPLGTEVGLDPDDIVLDGSQLQKRAPPPIFGPCLFWPNGRLSQLLLSSYLPFQCVICCMLTLLCVK